MAFLDFVPVVGSVVNGISSVISTSMSNRAARQNQAAAMDWNEKMNLQNQQWEEKMWNMNNEYNSPAQQVDRLLSAGINPNSAVGGMSQNATATQPQQPVIPSMNGAQVFPYDLDFLGSSLSTMEQVNRNKVAQKQSELMDAQSRLADKTADKVVEEMLTVIDTRKPQVNKLQAEAFKAWNEGDYQYYAGEVMRWNARYADKQAQANLLKARADGFNAVMNGMKTDQERANAKFLYENILPLQVQCSNAQIQQALAAAAQAYATAKKELQLANNAQKEGVLLDQSIEGGQSDLQVKQMTNSLTLKALQEYGAPISEMPVDDLTKIVMHLHLSGDSDAEIGQFMTDYFKLFDEGSGYWLQQNVRMQMGKGEFKGAVPDIMNSGYLFGRKASKGLQHSGEHQYHLMPQFSTSPSTWNRNHYDLR